MANVEVDTNHGQVAGTIVNHHAGIWVRPPAGHAAIRACPQCHGETWRLTQWCVHCGADLFAIDERERSRRAARRGMKMAAFFVTISALCFFAQPYAPPSAKLWVMGFGGLTMVLAAASVRG